MKALCLMRAMKLFWLFLVSEAISTFNRQPEIAHSHLRSSVSSHNITDITMRPLTMAQFAKTSHEDKLFQIRLFGSIKNNFNTTTTGSEEQCKTLYDIRIPPYTWMVCAVLLYYYIELNIKTFSLQFKNKHINSLLTASMQNTVMNSPSHHDDHLNDLSRNGMSAYQKPPLHWLPIDYFDYFQLLYVLGCLTYFILNVIFNNWTSSNNTNNNWHIYQQLTGMVMNSTVLMTCSAVLSDMFVLILPGYRDVFDGTTESTTTSIDVNDVHMLTNIQHNNMLRSESMRISTSYRMKYTHRNRQQYASRSESMDSTQSSNISLNNSLRHSLLSDEQNNTNYIHKLCSFIYTHHYPLLITCPIIIPFLTHCIVGIILYFWVFLIVLIGLPLIYLLLMIVKDCCVGLIHMYILHKETNFGTEEYYDLLRYQQSDRLLANCDILMRLFIYFVLTTSFNYAYLYYQLYAHQQTGQGSGIYTPTPQEYSGVTLQEYEYRHNLCFYSHIFDSIQSILTFFSFV